MKGSILPDLAQSQNRDECGQTLEMVKDREAWSPRGHKELDMTERLSKKNNIFTN